MSETFVWNSFLEPAMEAFCLRCEVRTSRNEEIHHVDDKGVESGLIEGRPDERRIGSAKFLEGLAHLIMPITERWEMKPTL